MTQRDKPHLFPNVAPRSEPFTLSSGGGGKDPIPFDGNRRRHGTKLKHELEIAFDAVDQKDSVKIDEGTYITFVSFAGLDLALSSMDPQSRGVQPELVAVTENVTENGLVQMATIYIPEGKKEYFFKRLNQYVETATAKKSKNANLVEGIQSIRRATIRELWTDPAELFPADENQSNWWEVWLRKRDGKSLSRFIEYAKVHSLATSKHYLGFGDRSIVLVRATTVQLAASFHALDDIAELRKPHDVSSLLTEISAHEQSEWVDELLARTQGADGDAPAVCILDTGVQDGHPLLEGSLHADDVHVADSLWRKFPVNGHGTEMAGLALFGDLHQAIISSDEVVLRHRLESVKLLPDSGGNEKDLYAAITARSVDRPEIQAPRRRRVFMIAVTANRPEPVTPDEEIVVSHEPGKPTSWSATIDALAFGRSIDDTDPNFTYLDRDEQVESRLFVISAGNIRRIFPSDDHLSRSDLEPVEDPAQAWNGLTVGAFTNKDDMSSAPDIFGGYSPLARRGELSPTSRTSVTFDGKKWPFKPDVVAEGGNVAVSPGNDTAETPENLGVLTTRRQRPGEGFFTTTRDTSAATAQVAAIAADIMAAYPSLKAETIRALIVHSAEWTPAMWDGFNAAANKRELVGILRRYGMGVPDVTRAIHSAADALTLISEGSIHPYERDGNNSAGKVREMNLHELPWPKSELETLGETEVRMRVTLSYFVEPNPSSRGWTGRYIYPSHGLRFAVRRPQESVETFRKRINKRARADGDVGVNLGSDSESRWFFGTNQQQSSGSLHTDIWEGPAAELASKESVAIYPVAGWWKERPHQDQSDAGVNYSLIVSIESPEVDVDLWTPVAQQISGQIVVEI